MSPSRPRFLDLLADLRSRFGLAMLFISHDLAVVSQVAHRVAVMYAGSVVELAGKHEIFHAPAHPYTRGLLQAVPDLKTQRGRPLGTIEGTVPPLHAMPPGCTFEPRADSVYQNAPALSPRSRRLRRSTGPAARSSIRNRNRVLSS